VNLILITLIFSMVACLPLGAEESIKDLIAKLGEGSSANRNQTTEAILNRLGEDPDHAAKLLGNANQSSDDPEVRARTRSLLEQTYRIYELGEGVGVFGIVVGWFLDHNGTELTSWPLVVQVARGTPAESAGFRAGDVIINCNGEDCHGINSRNDLIKRLSKIRPGTETTFKVRFSDQASAASTDLKDQIRDLKAAPMVRKDLNLPSRFENNQFKEWLRSQNPD
jgi:C-terminal processing protease CtpA/Prc